MVTIPGQQQLGQVGPAATRASQPRATAADFGAGTGEALQRGGALMNQAFAEAAQRIRTREDAVEVATTLSTFNEESAEELRRLQTEADFSNKATAPGYIQGLKDRMAKTLEQFSGSTEAKARLFERLEGIRSHYSMQAADFRLKAQETAVLNSIGQSLSTLSSAAYAAPENIVDLYDSWDTVIDDLAPAMTPEAEFQHRTVGRAQIAASALESFLDRGDYQAAQTLLRDTPGVVDVLSPEKQREFQGKIAAFQQAEAKAAADARGKYLELKTLLGREPTPVERARYAGVAPPKADRTVSDKIEEAETALGRKLTPEERERIVGVAPTDNAGAQSPQGKLVEDRQRFVDQYGEDSPQVKAFDEFVSSPEPPKLTDVAGQRKEFTNLSGVFVEVRDAYSRVTASAQEPSAAGDLSLLVNYMKILDPGSVVREQEFRTVAETGAFGERVTAAINQYLSGERLTPEIRQDFVERAGLLMNAQIRTQIRLEEQFRGLAQRNGMNPADVVVDFLGPYRPGGELPAGGAASEDGATTPEKPKPRFQVDLEGNIIGGGEQ